MLYADPNDLTGPISEEQQVIFDWVKQQLPKPKPKKTVFLAFQRSIADKLRIEIPDSADVYSLNGFGHSRVMKINGYQKLNSRRGLQLLEKLLGKPLSSFPYPRQQEYRAMLKYIHKLKQEDLMPSDQAHEFLQTKYVDLGDVTPPSAGQLPFMTDLMKLMSTPDHQLEYIDQLWLGEKCLRSKPYEIAFVDEFQDLSQIMLKLIYKSAEHIVFCGDPCQSITRFAGAGDNIYEELQAVCDQEMPLLKSFRCPPNIVQKANAIHPIKLRSNKTEPGEERRIHHMDVMTVSSPPGKSAVLCRTNAPLFALAMKLLSKGYPCYVLKSDIVESLETLLKYKKSEAMKHLQRQIEQSKKPMQQAMLRDQIEILQLLHDHPNPSEKLESLCKPGSDKLVLSTVHKAKGLECKNVTILGELRHPLAQRAEELAQEANIEFVAITRTSENLYWTTL